MERAVSGLFLILHGIVHLLYFGQSRRIFELKPGLMWPDGSWVFSRLIGDIAARNLANISLLIAAGAFAAGSFGLFLGQTWWRQVVVAASVFSAALFLLFWDGSFHGLDGKGGIGLLIDAGILLLVLVVKWPEFGF